MNKKKMIIGIASVCVVCAIVIGTTLAFLTDSEKVVNTFTVGDFDITLTEPHWNDGVPDDPKTTDTDESVPGDGSDLTPGSTKIKDPVVTANINSGYVRVIVSVIDRNKTIADPENVGKTIDNPNFGKLVTDKERLDLIMGTLYYDDSYNASATPATSKIVPDTKYSKDYLSAFNTFNTKDFTLDTSLSVNGKYYYNKNEILEEGQSCVLFTNVAVPQEYTKDMLGKMGSYQIVIQAEGIQSENFGSAEEALAALNEELTKTASGKN